MAPSWPRWYHKRVSEPQVRGPQCERRYLPANHEMKRYRVLAFDFDSRAGLLAVEAPGSAETSGPAGLRETQERIREGLLAEYGTAYGFRKIADFVALGPAPFSTIAFHNKFLDQIRNAFVMGGYYPSLTGACALGERLLNHLILALRDDFRSTPEYKKVYRKDSFDNWNLAIDTLEEWGVLLPKVATAFRELRDIRHRALHFDPGTDQNDRELGLHAVKTLVEIISGQFAAIGNLPWFIPGISGASFIKKAYETDPFVKRILVPNCRLVGARHTVDLKNNQFIVHDDHEYQDREISDEEFADLLTERRA